MILLGQETCFDLKDKKITYDVGTQFEFALKSLD
jgi:hypothetical protein